MSSTATVLSSGNRLNGSYLENRADVSTERLEMLWDTWHSQPEISFTKCPDTPSRIKPLEPSQDDLPPPVPPKPWLLDHRKERDSPKTMENLAQTISIPSPILEYAQIGSKLAEKSGTGVTSAFKSSRRPAIRSSRIPATVLKTPETPATATQSSELEREYFEPTTSAFYLIVDPSWDASKGNTADVYLLSRAQMSTDVAILQPRETYMAKAGISDRNTLSLDLPGLTGDSTNSIDDSFLSFE